MLTNWSTIQGSIRQLRKIEETLSQPESGFRKKELLQLQRQRDKLERSLGGIREMGGKPDLLFIIDTNREDIAVKEARKLGIPIVAIVDTNCSVEGIDYPIPGNDDATRAIGLYCRLISDAALSGLRENLSDVSFKEPAAAADQDNDAAEGKTERQTQEELTRQTRGDKGPRGGKGKAPAKAKAQPATSTKKEAFAEEAKKAKAKKDEAEPTDADDKKSKSKKSA